MRYKHTPETDARIRRGYQAGERVLDIANDLGVTRKVVIGRAFRLGLSVAGRQNEASKKGYGGYALHADPDRSAFVIGRLQAGRDLYNANRKANHSANCSAVPAK